MRVSASLLSTWMGCPLQAKFRYIDKLPDVPNAYSAFGSCVHHALDHYNKTGDAEAAVEVFKEVWEDPEKIGSGFEYWPKYVTYSGHLNRGIDMIREYHEKQKWENRIVIGSEHHFNVPFGEHRISGIVDLLEMKKSGRGKNTLKIVDYKTNTRPPRTLELRLNIQFTAYFYASLQPEFWIGDGPENPGLPDGQNLWDQLKDAPRAAFWYQLSNNKEMNAGDRDVADFKRMYRAVTEIERAIENEVFVPNISGDTCTFCPYTDPCGVNIPEVERDPELTGTLF